MAKLKIYTYPHAVLRKIAAPVTQFDKALETLALNMLETMYADEGSGLAANQVGVLQRLIVLDVSENYQAPRIFINPEITHQADSILMMEGCLSLPDLSFEVPRWQTISLKAQDLQGQVFELENITGLLAHCLQHEVDHLNGKLSIDRLSPLKKQFAEKKLRKQACGL